MHMVLKGILTHRRVGIEKAKVRAQGRGLTVRRERDYN
jgi:hypothetical protein